MVLASSEIFFLAQNAGGIGWQVKLEFSKMLSMLIAGIFCLKTVARNGATVYRLIGP
jgi:hypothetical protein